MGNDDIKIGKVVTQKETNREARIYDIDKSINYVFLLVNIGYQNNEVATVQIKEFFDYYETRS